MEAITEEQIETSFFERQLVVFKLGQEYLGVDISEVKEISKMTDITPVPHADKSIIGIINLRGQIMSVVNLGLRLGLPTNENADLMRVLVFDGGSSSVGFLVDSCNEVLRITGDVIKEAPKTLLDKIDEQYLQGVVVLDDRLISIIDLGLLISGDSHEVSSSAVSSSGTKKKILIIEDSSMMRGTLKSYVDKRVFDVFEAADGEEGIQLVKNISPDIVLLDIKLPKKDGVQVLREIKAFNEKINVVMETSVYEEDTKKNCISLGAKAYLKKPVSKKDLLTILNSF